MATTLYVGVSGSSSLPPSITFDDDDVRFSNNCGINTPLVYEGWPKYSNGFTDFDTNVGNIDEEYRLKMKVYSLSTSQIFLHRTRGKVI